MEIVRTTKIRLDLIVAAMQRNLDCLVGGVQSCQPNSSFNREAEIASKSSDAVIDADRGINVLATVTDGRPASLWRWAY